MTDLVGLVLAAGAGTRFGGPKALARTASGEPWLHLAVAVLTAVGCDEVLVVLGAEADSARTLVPEGATVIVAERWRDGMGASLAAGVDALPEADAALVTLVDLPDLPVAVLDRLLEEGTDRDVLARAVYAEVPGHPVLLGRDHWAAFRDSLRGDRGGATYLEEHGAAHVECGDLSSGRDVDRPSIS